MMNTDRPSDGLITRFVRRVQSLVASRRRSSRSSAASTLPKVLVVVEGPNDVEFLRRISVILHREDARVPDLADMERRQALVFVPSGGADSTSAFRFAALQLPEFHLLDRDVPPATESRQWVAAMVNSRPGCRAVVMSKRSLENYLTPAAIFEASGISIAISDDENVPELVARHAHEFRGASVSWEQLPIRTRKRLRDKAKKWLNGRAVEHMTPERLAAFDRDGEVRTWLAIIASLSGHGRP